MNLQSAENEKICRMAGNELAAMLSGMKKRTRRIKWYRRFLMAALFSSILALSALVYYDVDSQIPSVLYLREGMEYSAENSFDLKLPATMEIVSAGSQGESNIPQDAVIIDSRTVDAGGEDAAYRMEVKLFGVWPFRQVDVRMMDNISLIPVGKPIGIYLKAEGILVVGVGSFTGEDGTECMPARSILKSGDYIRRLNGESIDDKDVFIQRVKDSGGEPLSLEIVRAGNELTVLVTPKKDETGVYRIGAWIRDNAQGIGTMTYIDEEGNFGALGHGINDVDTATLMEMDDGTLYQTDIIAIHRGQVGQPGEMVGMIAYSDDHIIGDITGNNQKGIFGICNEKGMEISDNKALPIGLKQEIEKGAAEILCTVDGQTRAYSVEITAVHMNNDNVNRGIELTVTDPELLEITGGIIQGMSGAPIIQNDKLIGAVTHVLVSDPTRGYGIFIETMLGK